MKGGGGGGGGGGGPKAHILFWKKASQSARINI